MQKDRNCLTAVWQFQEKCRLALRRLTKDRSEWLTIHGVALSRLTSTPQSQHQCERSRWRGDNTQVSLQEMEAYTELYKVIATPNAMLAKPRIVIRPT